MKTILIKRIEHEEVPNDREFMQIYHAPYGRQPWEPSFPISKGVMDAVQTETIQMREFYDANHNRVRVGMSKEVSDVLGLQYAAVDELMSRSEEAERLAGLLRNRVKLLATRRDALVDEVAELRRGIYNIESAPFLTRLRWLFTRVK